ncbi:MAG: hypothetical protein DI539_28210 [Flavobacterium psychrophilum]|nr:MAG: hypothetical protein DI539_28210 [Flavobacterium psychrophilum]
MVAVQSDEVVQQKVWLIIGEDTGLYPATKKYLEGRGQTVFYNSDLDKLYDELAGILNHYKCIDMLIINDLKRDIHLQSLLESVYIISFYMRKDGTGQVIFMLSNELCFNHLENTRAYQKLKQDMKDLAIEVQCFESC